MGNKYKLREFKCLGCSKVVTKRRSKDKTKYCSLTCYRNSKRPQRKTGDMFICEHCGKVVYKSKSLQFKHVFCSVTCANMWQGRNKLEFNCKICGKLFKWSKSRLTQANPKYCTVKCRNADKEHMINCGIRSTLAQQKKVGLNKLELQGRRILEDIGVGFTEQVLMFNKFLVDVVLDSKKVIIQWDGDYWHSKPKRKALDKSQDAYMKKCGYKVLRITDIQIKHNLKEIYANIKNAIR